MNIFIQYNLSTICYLFFSLLVRQKDIFIFSKERLVILTSLSGSSRTKVKKL